MGNGGTSVLEKMERSADAEASLAVPATGWRLFSRFNILVRVPLRTTSWSASCPLKVSVVTWIWFIQLENFSNSWSALGVEGGAVAGWVAGDLLVVDPVAAFAPAPRISVGMLGAAMVDVMPPSDAL